MLYCQEKGGLTRELFDTQPFARGTTVVMNGASGSFCCSTDGACEALSGPDTTKKTGTIPRREKGLFAEAMQRVRKDMVLTRHNKDSRN